MLEAIQILLIIVITVLTIVLTIIGIQFFFILKEMRKSLQKANKMLDDGVSVSGVFAKSVTGFSGLLSGVKTGLSVINIFKKDRKEEDGEEE